MVRKVQFNNVAIYSSINNQKVNSIADQVIEILSNLKVNCVAPNSSQIKTKLLKKTHTDKTVIKQSDLIIAIGGDGTLLSTARNYGYYGIPVLGINLGNLGFLTDIQPSDLTFALNRILQGDFIEDKRIFLEAEIEGKNKKYQALNEVVLHSGSIAQRIEYDLFIDEEFVYRQKADGLIVSTSTGSTAYSLSGNGPIISPEVEAITLLPMFPHSLNARTLITSENKQIKIKVRDKSKAYLSMDSHDNLRVTSKESVYIRKANTELTLIHPVEHSFFSSCRTKLGWSLGIPSKNTA
ncbi:MAG: NAD(+)/NADH kinase [Gammaproteobacteria bacterium]